MSEPSFVGMGTSPTFPFLAGEAGVYGLNRPKREKKRVQFMYIFLYALFNLGCSLSLMYVMSLQMPMQLKFMLGKDSSLMLGIIVSFSSIVNIIGSILSGLIADKTNLHVLIIIVFNFLWSVTIVVRCFVAQRNLAYIFLYSGITMLGMFLYAFVEVPYTALLPGIFHKESYGVVGGATGFTMLIGTAIGISGLAVFYDVVGERFLSFLAAIFINFLSLALLPLIARKKQLRNNPLFLRDTKRREAEIALIKEKQQEKKGLGAIGFRFLHEVLYPFLKPFSHKNYTLVVLVRFWMYMGLATIQTYTLYFIQDVVGREVDGSYSVFGYNFIRNAEQAMGLFSLSLLIPALFSTIALGWLSDLYYHKKYYIFIACCVGSILQIIIVLTHNYSVMLLCGLIIGVCIGAFVSIDMALANEVLPERDEAGKDLAIYASSKTLPIMFATPIAGTLLYLGNENIHLSFLPANSVGYYIIYTMSAFFSLLSGLCVIFINNTKPTRVIYAKLVLED